MSEPDTTATIDPKRRFRGCRVVVVSGDEAGREIQLAGVLTVTVGRSADADETIADDGLSRLHARFQSTPAGVVVVDLDSRNGTMVNGEKIRRRVLVDGDRVTLATLELVFNER